MNIRTFFFCLVCCISQFIFMTSSYATEAYPQTDLVVALAGDQPITWHEVKLRLNWVKHLYRPEQLPSDVILYNQVLRTLINENLADQVVSNNHISISPQELIQAQTIFAAQTKQSSIADWKKLMHSLGFDETELDRWVRNEQAREKFIAMHLQQILSDNNDLQAYTNQAEILAHNPYEYHLNHILIALSNAPSSIELQKALQLANHIIDQLHHGGHFDQLALTYSTDSLSLHGGDMGWLKSDQIPHFLLHDVSRMSVGDIAGPIRSASGFHIISLVGKKPIADHQISDEMVEKYQLQQILLRPNAIRDAAACQKMLQKWRDMVLTHQKSFDELADEYTDDLPSRGQQGRLSWLTSAQMPKKMAEVVAKLKPGQISAPFQTELGYQLVKLLAKKQLSVTDVAKQQSYMAIQNQKYHEAEELWLQNLNHEGYRAIWDPKKKTFVVLQGSSQQLFALPTGTS